MTVKVRLITSFTSEVKTFICGKINDEINDYLMSNTKIVLLLLLFLFSLKADD